MLYTNINFFSVSCPLSLEITHSHFAYLVFYKPYESQGQAWPLTFIRLIWAMVIFLVFMIGFFILSQSYILSTLVVPLLIGTLYYAWNTHRSFRGLSKFVSLSSVCEVERGQEATDVVNIRRGHPVTWSQRCVLEVIFGKLNHIIAVYYQQSYAPTLRTERRHSVCSSRR
jgi:hypothetical protein